MGRGDGDAQPPNDGLRPGEIFVSTKDLKSIVAQYFAKRNLAFRLPLNNMKPLKVICSEHRDCLFLIWALQARGAETVELMKVEDEDSRAHADFEAERQQAHNFVR
ncbi:hypothetical protein Gpo141_00013628 [Globisporangium polare]